MTAACCDGGLPCWWVIRPCGPGTDRRARCTVGALSLGDPALRAGDRRWRTLPRGGRALWLSGPALWAGDRRWSSLLRWAPCPGGGSISLKKWRKEHQGLRPLDPGDFYGPLAVARSFFRSWKFVPSVEPCFFSKIEWAVCSARGRWFIRLLRWKVEKIFRYPPILYTEREQALTISQRKESHTHALPKCHTHNPCAPSRQARTHPT